MPLVSVIKPKNGKQGQLKGTGHFETTEIINWVDSNRQRFRIHLNLYMNQYKRKTFRNNYSYNVLKQDYYLNSFKIILYVNFHFWFELLSLTTTVMLTRMITEGTLINILHIVFVAAFPLFRELQNLIMCGKTTEVMPHS